MGIGMNDITGIINILRAIVGDLGFGYGIYHGQRRGVSVACRA